MSTPPRIVQGSVIFVVDGERVLLLQRNHQPFAGKWDGLQGLVEFGETPEEAAKRELAEEAQLTGELHYLIGFYLSPGFCDEKLHVFRATHTREAYAKPDDDEPKPMFDGNEFSLSNRTAWSNSARSRT